MNDLLGLAGTIFDLLLVVLGFGFIIFIHELGHFIAARWAGIRVLAFAIGFGSAAVSYRKGMGWRRGSSEKEYLERLKSEGDGSASAAISPTEYRINWLPLGGYVKMLGQDDMNPNAVSSAPDSYQVVKPWKRMVVISAGVVMNLILAATLFVGVFMYGLKTEPAKIGAVMPGSPASRAKAVNAEVPLGLKPGDVLLTINGRKPNSFNDLMLATAMTGKGDLLRVDVQRPGTAQTITFEVTPETGSLTGLQEVGVEPARSNRVLKAKNPAEHAQWREILAKRGLPGLEPGMTLIKVGDRTVESAADAAEAIRNSGGATLDAVFEGEGGKRISIPIRPEADLQIGRVPIGDKTFAIVRHLLGLTPVLKVAPTSDPSRPRQGLEDNDIFARIGAIEFPSSSEGIAEIKAHKGSEIPVSVLRRGPDGTRKLVRITPSPKVRNENGGVIGFERADTSDDSTLLSLPPSRLVDARHPGDGSPPAAASIVQRPGSVIAAIGGTPVANFSDIRAALRKETLQALESKAEKATVRVSLAPPPLGDSASAPETVDWNLSKDDIAALHALSWTSKLDSDLFEPEQFTLQASSPLVALNMGLSETKRVMLTTYITFARLFQGTVKVEHLKGPVGIAHLGTRIAEKGLIWLLFFMALISVNLAVINFLPLPIVDGGQFLFLLVEQIRGKPVPVAIQNIATIAGLMLIGTMFVIVTYHDIVNLFG